MKKKIIKYIGLGIIFSFAAFLLYGIPTAIIPNPFFKRMTVTTKLDLTLLILTAILLGSYLSLYFYSKKKSKASNIAVTTGGFTGIFAFSCPVCNVLLVSLFGSAALLTYFEPIRPLIGVFTIGILGSALYFKVYSLKKCNKCGIEK